MELRDYPEWATTFSEPDIFPERENSLSENIERVHTAKAYFDKLQQKTFGHHIDPRDVNIGHVYTLNDCIKFAENKKKINEKIQKGLNDIVYQNMTGRYTYSSIIESTKHLVNAFFDSHINKAIRENRSQADIFLRSDARKQASRLCDYILKYLQGYTEDDRLNNSTREEIAKILSTAPEIEVFVQMPSSN